MKATNGFNGAAIEIAEMDGVLFMCGCIVSASMGPRLKSRKWRYFSSRFRRAATCFNGAAIEIAEMVVQLNQFRIAGIGFNGAAIEIAEMEQAS